MDLDQLNQRVAEFRKQREKLRDEHGAFKSENEPLAAKSESTHNMLFVWPIIAVLAVSPVVWWLASGRSGQSSEEVRGTQPINVEQAQTAQAAAVDRDYSTAIESPAADRLEERVSSLTGNMEVLSDLITDLESKLIATETLEDRISGLTENLQVLSTLTTDLELKQEAADELEARLSDMTEEMDSLDNRTADLELRQVAAYKLEERISGLNKNVENLDDMTSDLEARQAAVENLESRISEINKNLQMLSDLAAGLETQQVTALASAESFVPATQPAATAKTSPEAPKPAPQPRTEEPKLAQNEQTAETRWKSVPATGDPKPTTKPQTSKLDLSLPKSLPEPAVFKKPVTRKPATVSAPKASSGDGPWKINLISSPAQADAMRFAQRAKDRGVSTKLQEVTVKGTPYWRVQVTGFASREEATAYSEIVKDKLGLNDTWIMKR